MPRASLWFIVFAPVAVMACAQGSVRPTGEDKSYKGDGGSSGGGTSEVGDPGSSDPGSGAGGSGASDPGVGGGGVGAGGGGSTTCAHDPCAAGAGLDPSCDPCVKALCDTDSFCCEMQWDEQCVTAATQCSCQTGAGGSAGVGGGGAGGGGAGGGGAGAGGGGGAGASDPGAGGGSSGGMCEHDLCATGAPLDPGCDECAQAVCSVDPFCCATAWDINCVFDIEFNCNGSCF
jgi:hypothetical protein